MTKPIDFKALMMSAQDIVNDDRIKDSAYVFIKKGKLYTEGRFSHAFTFQSTKAKTAQFLASAFTKSYSGDDVIAARNQFDPFLYGAHQLRVKDLRNAFKTAEAGRLTAMSAELRSVYGDGVGDALAPLTAHVNNRRSVTQPMIGQVVDRVFGEGTASVVLQNREGAGLESLPEVMSSAKAQVEALRAKPARVANAVMEACRRGPLMKASLEETINDLFATPSLHRLRSSLRELPERPTLEQATKLFEKANALFVSDRYAEFKAEVLKDDQALFTCLGLDEKSTKHIEFTDEIRRDVMARLPQAQADAKRVRDAAASFLAEHSKASQACKESVRKKAEALVSAGRFSEAAVKEMLDEAATAYQRETDFDFGLAYELNHRPGWSEDDKAFYSDVMKRLNRFFPTDNLFTDGAVPVAERVARILNHNYVGQASDAAAFSREGQVFYVAMLALTDACNAPDLCRKLPEILAGGDPDAVTWDDIARHCYGVPSGLEAGASRGDVQRQFMKLQGDYIAERLNTPERLEKCRRQARREKPRAKASEIEAKAQALCLKEVSVLRVCLQAAMTTGLSLESAIARGNNLRLPLLLKDFAMAPSAHSLKIPDREQAMANWANDFQRQGQNEANRSEIGPTTVTVTEPQGAVTKVHNGTEGLSPEELVLFNKSKVTSKHRTVEAALERLCGPNARQCDAAIEMMSQNGPISAYRSFGSVMEGSGANYEHTAVNYQFTKNDQGDVLLSLRTSAAGNATLDVKVVIHPDGTHRMTAFSFLPAPAQEGPQAA